MTVEFWGVLERFAGEKSRALRLDEGSTVEAVLARIAAERPDLAEPLARSACAIGDELVGRGHRLSAGTTLALLPPVAGG